jgi:ATP-dependent RNA helicase DDX56/DBP9
MALSFVVPASLYRKHKPTSIASCEHDEAVLAKILKHQQKRGHEVKDYQFDMTQVDGFRYRMNDALRAVTRVAIREARTRELRQELLNSEKLKRHFEENPDDLKGLRHDGELRAARVQSHLKHVPEYLLPEQAKRGNRGLDVGFVGFNKGTGNRIRRARLANRAKGRGKKSVSRKVDPLKTFKGKSNR